MASHVTFSAYGFWLPNDPRGSGSGFVGSKQLLRFGDATKVNTTRSVAHVAHDSGRRRAAKLAMDYPPVRFSGRQALEIARGFADASVEGQYIIYACCILPEHVHLVVAHHARDVEKIAGHLKSAATRRLAGAGLHPFGVGATQSPWARGCWKVFLNESKDVRRAIAYVENNPLKEGKRRQKWSFVTLFSEGDAV
ncbi:MAG TPA: hypothetical protein VMD30_13995 [Tepidisphaeraceae bacterium]|nr:hypothetical protein [Tepidisphaeraceae bacterium]